MRALRWADGQAWLQALLGAANRLAFAPGPVEAGGVALQQPLILAAGLVKGDGFETEADALAAVGRGENIMPGWRSMPNLAGLVEFGSFTRWPRQGNPGVVVWRDAPARSTQNRVGLRNPGAAAAAAFLAARKRDLPDQYGFNVAVSPGVDDAAQQTGEVREALGAFVDAGVYPDWFTLNLSCPNTGDDPRGHQTAELAAQVCGAAVDYLETHPVPRGVVPLWVKVGPDLADDQYRALVRVFADVGVRAVVATNTLPAPASPNVTAGVGGGRLHNRAVEVAALLAETAARHGCPVDVVGCGGVEDGATYRDFIRSGARAVQYWSTLIYRGPLAAALILHQARSTTHE
jgi:dihydroorotate dehydrogenase